MTLLDNIPRELVLIIRDYSEPIKCSLCENMSFEIKSSYTDAAINQCYTCLKKCDLCDSHCEISPKFDISQRENIHRDLNCYYPGTRCGLNCYFSTIKCGYCNCVVCIFCINELNIHRQIRGSRTIFKCNYCMEKCKKCNNIIHDYYTYNNVYGHRCCLYCERAVNDHCTHCKLCETCYTENVINLCK